LRGNDANNNTEPSASAIHQRRKSLPPAPKGQPRAPKRNQNAPNRLDKCENGRHRDERSDPMQDKAPRRAKPTPIPPVAQSAKEKTLPLRINGKDYFHDGDADMPLLWYLRDVLRLTGTKFGCGIGACGACTVLIDGKAQRACLTPVKVASGH